MKGRMGEGGGLLEEKGRIASLTGVILKRTRNLFLEKKIKWKQQ